MSVRRFVPGIDDVLGWWTAVVIAMAGTNSTRIALMVTVVYWWGWLISRFRKEKPNA